MTLVQILSFTILTITLVIGLWIWIKVRDWRLALVVSRGVGLTLRGR